MQKNTIKIVGATLVIVAALVFLFLTMTPSAPNVNRKLFEGIGQTAADEVQKCIGTGGRVALITRDTRAFASPHMETMQTAFLKSIRQHKISVAKTNFLKEDPGRPVRVPPADYVELFQKLGEKDVIVSFMGPPVLTAAQKKTLPEKGPKVIALCPGAIPWQVNLKELFAESLLHAAIISRANPDANLPKNGNARAWFENYYLVVTGSNLSDLAGPAETANH